MRFEVLGTVRALRDGTELDLGARQPRLILTLLLANAGRAVGLADIVDLLWGDRPPRSAVNVVHRYVGALRRTFEPDLPPRATGRWLVGDAAGYRMRVGPDDLDLLRLRTLAEQARSDESAGRLPEALAAYETALALWRGPCGAAGDHLAFDLVDHECADVARTAAALALRLGSVRSVLPVLRRMAEHRRLDEALHSQLLLTLCADGHQAEAIALYQTLRMRLTEELGVDPGEELRDAYRSVLDPNAAEPVPPSGQLRISRLPVTTLVLPAQLPPDLPYFTGRDDVRNEVLDLVDDHGRTQGSMPILAVDGLPGIGKTSVAVHLAHQLAPAYPDGRLPRARRAVEPGQQSARTRSLHRLAGAFLHTRGPDIRLRGQSHHAVADSGIRLDESTGRRSAPTR
ncbi:winged helix-turn-helix domain-containing protein [Actinoplanes sp. TRM 88003]|uniref:Winged helix-turn-helix domain-containing protein n=1 Tax=Paractinoplanes aksuensis TaxID=2939490 RepID=A0ABT1DXH2_9ACTN|nr:BTAD domain-containing putative transcriptional regulator [Actinoplanes aksuensis]MCO8275482.1 winged helix-turn-helix domain-containing protein [Actinoplanes aksuensis]